MVPTRAAIAVALCTQVALLACGDLRDPDEVMPVVELAATLTVDDPLPNDAEPRVSLYWLGRTALGEVGGRADDAVALAAHARPGDTVHDILFPIFAPPPDRVMIDEAHATAPGTGWSGGARLAVAAPFAWRDDDGDGAYTPIDCATGAGGDTLVGRSDRFAIALYVTGGAVSLPFIDAPLEPGVHIIEPTAPIVPFGETDYGTARPCHAEASSDLPVHLTTARLDALAERLAGCPLSERPATELCAPVVLAHDLGAITASAARDGVIAFVSDGQAYRWDVADGASPQPLPQPHSSAQGLAFDDRCVFWSGASRIRRHCAGGDAEVVAAGGPFTDLQVSAGVAFWRAATADGWEIAASASSPGAPATRLVALEGTHGPSPVACHAGRCWWVDVAAGALGWVEVDGTTGHDLPLPAAIGDPAEAAVVAAGPGAVIVAVDAAPGLWRGLTDGTGGYTRVPAPAKVAEVRVTASGLWFIAPSGVGGYVSHDGQRRWIFQGPGTPDVLLAPAGDGVVVLDHASGVATRWGPPPAEPDSR